MSKNEKDSKIAELQESVVKLEKLANHYMTKANQLENQLVLAQEEEQQVEMPDRLDG